MLEKPLHGLNIAAAIGAAATAADLTLFGGAGLAITSALSGVSLFKKADKETRDAAKIMSPIIERELRAAPLSDDLKKVVIEMLRDHAPTPGDIAEGSGIAETVARNMRNQIASDPATDPARQNARVLNTYTAILSAALEPVVAPASQVEADTKVILQRLDQTGEFQRMRDEGITEKAILRLARRVVADAPDLGAAWAAVEDAVQEAVDRAAATRPDEKEYQREFAALVEELNRRSNLPYEVELERAKAKTAIEEKRFNAAKSSLDKAANLTRNTAAHAVSEYARSLASLGALAFTVDDFFEARKQYGQAMSLAPLEQDQVDRYCRSYRIASNAWMARGCSYPEAREILDEMTGAGVTPDEYSYSTLIKLAPDYAEGRNVLDELVGAGIAPSEYSYSALINLAPDYDEGRKVLDEMIGAGIAPNEYSYSALINLAPDYAEGRKVLGEMIGAGVAPNHVSYNTLINLAPDYAEGRKVLGEMIDAGVPADQYSYSTLINLAPDYTEGRKVLDEMIGAGVAPNEYSYSTLINLAPDYTEGRKVLEEMISAGVPADQYSYSTLINLAPDYTEGRKVLGEMVGAGVRPDEITLSALIIKAPNLGKRMELARYSKHPSRNWYTGRGFYEALFSLPTAGLTAEDILEAFDDLPFKFDTALAGPIKKFAASNQMDMAFVLCLRVPYLPTSEKYFAENAEFCRDQFAQFDAIAIEDLDLAYAHGIFCQITGDVPRAIKLLSFVANHTDIEPRRRDALERIKAIS